MEEKNSINIKVKLTKAIYSEFINNSMLKQNLTLCITLFILFIAISGLFIYFGNFSSVLLSFIVFLAIILYYIVGNKSKILKDFKKRDMENTLISYTITHNELIVLANDKENKIKYKKMLKVASTKNTILFYINPSSAYIVPKSELSDLDINKLRGYLEKNIPIKSYKIK